MSSQRPDIPSDQSALRRSQQPARPTPSPVTRVDLILLAVIVCLGAAARFIHIADASLWTDEIWSIEVASGRGSAHAHLPANLIQTSQPDLTGLAGAPPWWRVWPSIAQAPGHPPLYYLLLRFWMNAYGSSEAALRSLSAVASVLALLVFFDLVRLLYSAKAALSSAAIMALALPQVEFAQDVRSYAMLILLALCAADALVRIEIFSCNSARLAALALSGAATALTHYFSLGLLIALAAYAAIRLRGRARRNALTAFAAAAICVLLVWGPWIVAQFRNMPTAYPAFLTEDAAGHTQSTLLRAIGLSAQYLLGEFYAGSLHWLAILAIAVFTFIVPWTRLKWRRDLLLWCLWLLGTTIFMTAYDLFHPAIQLAYLRYTILAAPAVYALFGSFDFPRQRLLGQIIPAAVIAVLAILMADRLAHPSAAHEDWRQLAAILDEHAAPDELLVFYGDDPWQPPAMWYMGIKYYSPTSNRPWLILTRRPSRQLLSQLGQRHSLWLIGRFPATEGPRLLPGWQAAEQATTTAGAVCHFIGGMQSSSRP